MKSTTEAVADYFFSPETPAPLLPNKREQEKSRLLAVIADPLESTLCRQLAGEELFALGRLVELDFQLSQVRGLNDDVRGDIRRQAG